MSTPGEQLEATVWLEATFPDIPDEQRTAFFAAVDTYYDRHPVAERCPDTIGILHQDDRAFAEMLRSIMSEQHTAEHAADTP